MKINLLTLLWIFLEFLTRGHGWSLDAKATGGKVPYGVYNILNLWGCDAKELTCNRGLKVIQDSLVNDWLVTLMDSAGKGDPWEITPFGGNLYQIRSKSNCDPEDPLNSSTSCNGILSHRNGFAEVAKDMASYWNIFPRQTGDTQGWAITSANVGDFQNQVLSFNKGMENLFLQLMQDDLVTWDLQLDTDFIESQNLDEVDFDLRGSRVISEENVTLTTDEVHNQADFDIEGDVSLGYDLTEGNKFLERSGIALPMITSIVVPDPIYTGENVVLTNKVVYTIPWRTEARRIIPIRVVTKVKVPAKSFRMISVDGIRNILSLPFTGLMRRKFNTGKEAASQINGILITEQIRNIVQNIGSSLAIGNQTLTDIMGVMSSASMGQLPNAANLMGQFSNMADMMSQMPHSADKNEPGASFTTDSTPANRVENMTTSTMMEVEQNQLSTYTKNETAEIAKGNETQSTKRRYL